MHIFEKAVSGFNGITTFTNSDNNSANTICTDSPMFKENKTIEVDAVTLDQLYHDGFIEIPQLIKMDIEGAEYDALTGAKELLSKHHPTIFLSTHNCQNNGVHKECIALLTEYGYSLKYLEFHKKITEEDDPWYELLAEKISN